MTDHEVTSTREVWLSYEDDKPTLWDAENHPPEAIRAVWCVGLRPERIEVYTDPEVVSAYLDTVDGGKF